MEERLIKLEEFASETRERLAKIELRLEQTATKADIADMRADMQKSHNETLRWMIATAIGLFVGFGGLFFMMSNSMKSPTPIVIYAQPPATPPAVGKP
jgi:hypothetical protein